MDGHPTVGVLTFHRCINHGSYWQARSLIDGLRARGQHAVVLDHHSHRVNYAEWRCALRPIPTPEPFADRRLYRRKLAKFTSAVSALPSSPSFDLSDPSALDRYGTVVVGSDEVWNLHHPWYGGHPLFFGVGITAPRLVSYAATFGNYDADHGLDAVWGERLRQFHSISVRDDNSRAIVARALGGDPALVLDPCLQFPPGVEGGWTGPDEPFVALYGHSFSASFIREVRRWSRQRGLPLVSLSYRNDWADHQWLSAGPHDFAQAMARAEGVVTNFFHGCVFALLNRQPFVCESSPYRRNKVQCLMAAVGGERHLVSEMTRAEMYDAVLDQPVEPAIYRSIDRLRAASSAYLDAALA